MERLLVYGHMFLFLFLLSCDRGKNQPEENISLAAAISQANCESPDASAACCFENMPKSLTSVMEIASADEEGKRISISGIIFQPDGKTPFSNVILYAYHTDAKGIYSKSGNEKGAQKYHGRLHGWCKTGSDGRYEIRSIRPGSYPNSRNPEHIHAAVMLPGTHRAIFIGEFLFSDDPLLSGKDKSYGMVVEMKHKDNLFIGEQNIIIK